MIHPKVNLSSFSLKDLPQKQIITINPEDSIPSVLEKIFAHHINSAPVVDKNNKLIGSISIIDIILFVLNVCHSSQEVAKYLGIPQEKADDFVDFTNVKNYMMTDMDIQQSFGNPDVAVFITNYSRRNLLQVLPPTSSFVDLVRCLCEHHRVAVGDDELYDYITQSDVVKFLKEKNVLGELGSKTIKELGIGTANVISVTPTQRVIEAFKKIVLNKVSGIAVIDENGRFVGQISSSDLKGISGTGEKINHLYETWTQYRKVLVEKYNAPLKLITVGPDTTFAQLVDTFVSHKLHRLYVVKDDNIMVSVISLTDVLRTCLGQQ